MSCRICKKRRYCGSDRRERDCPHYEEDKYESERLQKMRLLRPRLRR